MSLNHSAIFAKIEEMSASDRSVCACMGEIIGLCSSDVPHDDWSRLAASTMTPMLRHSTRGYPGSSRGSLHHFLFRVYGSASAIRPQTARCGPTCMSARWRNMNQATRNSAGSGKPDVVITRKTRTPIQPHCGASTKLPTITMPGWATTQSGHSAWHSVRLQYGHCCEVRAHGLSHRLRHGLAWLSASTAETC